MAAVVVIGAGLAGMSAAARLAKAGHQVTLVEQADRVGGSWALRDLDGAGVDAAPPIFSFPAPWRDLFRKSGRALEAEFARSGEELMPAAPARHVFDDGTDFILPISRGDQHAAIADRFGRPAADRWQDLVDGLGEVWQALRPLGVESELTDRSQLGGRTVRRTLRHQQTIADLAARIDQPALAAIILDLARTAGSDPRRTPAFVAVQLYLDRTFGRWTAGAGSTMINTLEARLRLRRVQTLTGVRATAITVDHGRVRSVRTEGGELAADAVICTCDPLQLYRQLLPRALPGTAARRERRRLARLKPVPAPTVTLRWSGDDPGPGGRSEPTETVRHRSAGGPRIDWTRRVGSRLLQISHDWDDPRPEPGAGLAWRGFDSWLDRPPVSSALTGLFTAGAYSRGGPMPSMQVLSGSLAAYGAQRLINPDKPLEPR